tara:strand:- start:52 stop:696 length:645 start_codon:yes stop_codon:yes gene_type:complete
MKDTFRHKGLRKILVDKLREKGISNEKILDMINKIPRHLFMDNAFIQFAYQDKAFPIGSGQTISQPYTVAFQTQLLDLNPYDKVLEVGTGSGYQTAVLVGMEGNVYTIERQKELFIKTKVFLPTLGYNCNFYYGDGYNGLNKFAPFDKIIVTCGASEIPSELINQLKIGGSLVAPIGASDIQEMHLIKKLSKNDTQITKHGKFSFVPMLSDKSN